MYFLIYLLPFYLLAFYVVNLTQQTDVHSTKQVTEKTIPAKSMESLKEECQHCLKFSREEEDLELEPESELLQQCAIDLCGPANESPKYVFNNTIFNRKNTTAIDPKTDRRFNENILPLIEEAIQAQLNYKNATLTLLEEKLQNPDANITPEEWEKIALYLLHRKYKHHFNLSSYDDTEKNDTEKKDVLTEAYQEFLKEYENKETELTEEDKEKITLLGQELNKDDFDLESFAERLNNLIRKVKTASCSQKPSCKKRVYDALSNFYRKLRFFQNIDRINETIQYCRSNYFQNMVDASQSKTFKDNLEDYKNRFLDRGFADYSQTSKHAFEKYMNETLKITFLSEESIDSFYTDILTQSISRTRDREKYISLSRIIREHPEEIGSLFDACPSSIVHYEKFKNTYFNPIEQAILHRSFPLYEL